MNTSPSAAMASSVSVLSKGTIYSSIELAFVEDREQLGNEILMLVLKYHNLNYFYKNVCIYIYILSGHIKQCKRALIALQALHWLKYFASELAPT